MKIDIGIAIGLCILTLLGAMVIIPKAIVATVDGKLIERMVEICSVNDGVESAKMERTRTKIKCSNGVVVELESY